MILIRESQFYILEHRHHTKSVNHLEEESRTDVVDKRIGILEILWVLIIVIQDIIAIVWVSLAVFISIGLIQRNTYFFFIGQEIPDTVLVSEVVQRKGNALLQSVSPDITLCHRIIIAVIGLGLAHRLAHLQKIDFDGSQRITIALWLIEIEPDLTGVDIDAVTWLHHELVLIRQRVVLQHVELGHKFTLDVWIRLGVFHDTDITVEVADINGISSYRSGIGLEDVGFQIQQVRLKCKRGSNRACIFAARQYRHCGNCNRCY